MRGIARRCFSGMDDGGLASFLTPIKVQGRPCHARHNLSNISHFRP
jgi:hypothetical protein